MNAPMTRPSGFAYSPMFPLGPTQTAWKRLPIGGVRTATCDGQTVLRIAPDATLAEAPQLDILHVPGGPGQQVLMEDEEALGWLRRQAAGAKKVLSVCTGALLFGGAGLIRGKRATTHWASFHLLPWFGALPVDERVVVDGDWIFAAGVTAGIDGALLLAAEVRGVPAAQRIQLDIAYAPEPPFQSGTPRTGET